MAAPARAVVPRNSLRVARSSISLFQALVVDRAHRFSVNRAARSTRGGSFERSTLKHDGSFFQRLSRIARRVIGDPIVANTHEFDLEALSILAGTETV